MTLDPNARWPGRDFFLASYPKSGRTWLRFFLASYLVYLHEIPINIDFHTVLYLIPEDLPAGRDPFHKGREEYRYARVPAMPRGLATHDYVTYRGVNWYQGAPLIFLYRSFYATIESYWHHCTAHYDAYHLGAPYRWEGDKREFLRWAANDYFHYWQAWMLGLRTLSQKGPVIMLSYERLSDDEEVWKRLIAFLGWQFDPVYFELARGHASFGNMARIERKSGMPGWDGQPVPQNGRRCRKAQRGSIPDWLFDNEFVREITAPIRYQTAPPDGIEIWN